MNTTFRVKYPIEKFNVYVGIGPKVDIPISSHCNLGFDSFYPESPLNFKREKLKTSFGFIPELGCMYDINQFRLSLNASWLVNFGKIYDNETVSEMGIKVTNNVFMLRLGVGYFLK